MAQTQLIQIDLKWVPFSFIAIRKIFLQLIRNILYLSEKLYIIGLFGGVGDEAPGSNHFDCNPPCQMAEI